MTLSLKKKKSWFYRKIGRIAKVAEYFLQILELYVHSLVAQTVKNLPAMWETWVQSRGWEDPLEKGMATHSNILAWRIPWTEEPDRLQTMESQRVRHDLATEK